MENHFEIHTQSLLRSEKQNRLRALGAMAAGFSHEFASPLNVAKLRLDRLERHLKNREVPADTLENLTEAKSSLAVCENVIRQMNSSQMDVRDFSFKEILIDELILDVLDTWKEEKNCTKIVSNIQKGVRGYIPPINFSQVILNLLDNALEASPNSEIIVQLKSDLNHVHFIVKDQGAGFPDQVLNRQGEPFVTTKSFGTGLGLYVSNLFAQSLGGDLKLTNNPNGGATIAISWPIDSNSKYE